MNRQLLRLQRQLLNGPDKGCPPFTRYCYNSFSWSAQDFSYHAKTEDERQLCMFLKEIAIRKSKELLAQEQTLKTQHITNHGQEDRLTINDSQDKEA